MATYGNRQTKTNDLAIGARKAGKFSLFEFVIFDCEQGEERRMIGDDSLPLGFG